VNRRAFLAGLGSTVLAAPRAAGAQPAGRVWRVGWLQPSPPASAGHINFQQAMRELGYAPGENVRFEDRSRTATSGGSPVWPRS